MSNVIVNLEDGVVTWKRSDGGYLESEIDIISLDEWADIIDVNNEEKGWNTPSLLEVLNKNISDGILTCNILELVTQIEKARTPAEWAALVHSEISEAYEEHRSGHKESVIYYSEGSKPEGQAVEYADALIRMLHWFKRNDMKPSEMVAMKMHYNTTRPFRHGNKVS